MNQRWDVLGIGNAAVDELIYLREFPPPDSKTAVLETQRQGGGLTATALVAAARQGARAGFCTQIGFDDLSTFTLEDLAREGVDCSPSLRTAAGVPYHAFIIVERAKHTRTILYQPGVVEPPLEAITEELVGACKLLFFDHHVPSAGLKAALIAHRLGIPVASDIETDRLPGLEQLVALSDHLILSEQFAAKISGRRDIDEMVRALSVPGRAACVVTAGARGCWYSERGGEVIHTPAYQVEVVDTTGCGDVFHGSYAAAIARGESIRQAVEIANASAALKATQPGGRAGIPDRVTAEHFMRAHGRN